MKYSTVISTTIGSLVALVVLAILGTGCAESRQNIRHIDQHPSGEFNTVQTSNENVLRFLTFEKADHGGFNFWNCQQIEGELKCTRVCDDRWYDGRICDPNLHHEFGTVSEPGSGIAVARYHAQLEREGRLRDVAVEETDDGEAIQVQESESQDSGGDDSDKDDSESVRVIEQRLQEDDEEDVEEEEDEIIEDGSEESEQEEEIEEGPDPVEETDEIEEVEEVDEVDEVEEEEEPSIVDELFGGSSDDEEEDR